MSKMMEYATDQEILDECAEIGAWGLCTSIDLRRCDPKIIRDRDRLHQFIIEVCDLIEMKRFGEPQIIHFGPTDRVAGYSLTQLIETSCITAHFANETDNAYIDIFSCKMYQPMVAARFCKQFFGAEDMEYTVIIRP
jgi:S-adenosylmethionine/arginine decarboxylase-like enzyme